MSPRFLTLFLALLLPLTAVVPARAEIPPDILREILVHEQSRNSGDGVLAQLSRHDDPAVRIRALRALGRLQDLGLLNDLARGLEDKNESVREEAAFDLGQLFDPSAEAALVNAWKEEKSPRVRRALIEALGKCGTESAALPILTDVLGGDDTDMAAQAAMALGIMAYQDFDISSAGGELRNALTHDNPPLQWRAAFAVFRGKVNRSMTGLLQSLKSSDPNTLIYSCRAMGALKNRNMAERLVPLLQNEDWRVRVEALRALGAIRDKRQTGMASLALDDPNEHVRLTAIATMGKLARSGGLGRIQDMQESSNWRERTAVLKAMAEGQGEGALVELKYSIKDPDWRVRQAAAQALASVPTEHSLLLMESMVNDDSPQVLSAVVGGLADYPQVHAVTLLRPFLNTGDPAILSGAASALGTRMDREAVPGLIAAYEKLVSPVDTETMVTILDALGSILSAKEEDDPVGVLVEESRKQAMALLESARHDADRNVARAAARNLSDITGEMVEAASPTEPRVPGELDLDLALQLAARTEPVVARLETSRGTVVIELLGSEAPGTVANFISLARRGYYNGLSFHRVVADFVVQGGDPRGDGWGGPGYAIRCEYNPLRYDRGMVGMALAGKDTGGSQFFITHSPQPHLNGRYTIFGRVSEGMDVVDQIQVGDLINEIQIEGL